MAEQNARVRVKLCGLREPWQVALAAEIGVEFIGIMFAAESRRRVTVEEAKSLMAALGRRPAPERIILHEALPPVRWFERCALAFDERLSESRPLAVGVFVDQPPPLINGIADAVGLDVVQLSGSEPWEQALAIQRPVIKAVHVAAGMPPDAIVAECEVGTAAACLLDTAVPGEHGGTGKVFDWEIAREVARQLPCFLAGGLTPENVAGAVRLVRPWAVDVSNGIETDGRKDADKMREFVAAVRAAAASLRTEEERGP